MKRKLLLTAIALAFSTAAGAQNICLGERIPDVQVSSALGESPENIATDYVCLIFFHTGSAPCVDSVDSFVRQAGKYPGKLSVVLITNELREQKEAELKKYVSDNVTVVFDREGRTFDNFGIRYVPFCVIYDTKRRKAQWSGSIQQLNSTVLKSIVTKKPQ